MDLKKFQHTSFYKWYRKKAQMDSKNMKSTNQLEKIKTYVEHSTVPHMSIWCKSK
jgi:ABC-type microcin C transport system permease subunit YejB